METLHMVSAYLKVLYNSTRKNQALTLAKVNFIGHK